MPKALYNNLATGEAHHKIMSLTYQVKKSDMHEPPNAMALAVVSLTQSMNERWSLIKGSQYNSIELEVSMYVCKWTSTKPFFNLLGLLL
jgi:hypothetical protein